VKATGGTNKANVLKQMKMQFLFETPFRNMITFSLEQTFARRAR